MRRQVRNARILLLVASALCVCVGMLDQDFGIVAAGVFILAFVVVFLKRLTVWSVVRNALRQMKEGKGMLGDHEFEVSDGDFIERASGTETKTDLRSLHAVCETDSHVFVYINPMMAHIIPKRDVTSEVVESLRKMREAIRSQEDGSGTETAGESDSER